MYNNLFRVGLFVLLGVPLVAKPIDKLLLKSLLQKIEEKVPAGFRDEPGNYIDNTNWREGSAYNQLVGAVRDNWPEVLDSISEIAPKGSSQVALIVSAQSALPLQDYVQFMSKSIDLAARKVILNRRFINWGLHPQSPPLAEFLTNSYTKPQVRALINKAKVLFADSPRMTHYFDNILSGKAKNDSDALVMDSPFTPAPPNAGKADDIIPTRRVWPPSRLSAQYPSNGSPVSSANTDGINAKRFSETPLIGGSRIPSWLVVIGIVAGFGILVYRVTQSFRR